MSDYEADARAAELRGLAEAARIRARALDEKAEQLEGTPLTRLLRRMGDMPTKREEENYQRRHKEFIAREVAAGRMCPGGCDTAVGGCFKHADRC